jgi:hypothetical protein
MTHYCKLFSGDDISRCLEQWGRLKIKIAKNKTLKDLKFNDLWPKILVHFHDTFEVVLRLVIINWLFVMDNSECERDFSALNDLKDELQSRLSHDLTEARLWWYKMKKELTPSRWREAVQRIGQEWLKATETKSGSRRAHGAAPPLDEVSASLEAAVAAAQADTVDVASSETVALE